MWSRMRRKIKTIQNRDPWVVQWFGACLWPWARSWRPEMESHFGLPVHGACFSLCLCLCLSVTIIKIFFFKKKLKIELPYDSKIAELGIYPVGTKVL